MPDRQSLHLAHAGFESARQLTQSPPGHPTARWHGHSFGVQVAAGPDGSWDALQSALTDQANTLDHQNLNALLGQSADDGALLQWFAQNLRRLNPVWIELNTAPGCWAKLNCNPRQSLTVTQGHAFEAAHQLPNVPPGHKCGRMHGHGFSVRIASSLALEDSPVAVRDRIDQAWRPLAEQLHWSCLNDIDGLENPTSEHLAVWLWTRLGSLPGLESVAVNETPTAGCWFDGERMRIWKEQTLDCAVRLTDTTPDDPRRTVHGHTFNVRLHLSGPIDETLGWVHDFGDVKQAFKPIFERLDHHPLYTIEGLEHADSMTLAHWIHSQTESMLPGLCGVDVEHTTHAGASVMRADGQETGA